MAGILKRTCYFEKMGTGEVRISEMAVCVTGIGSMCEPFELNNRYVQQKDFSDFDPTDMMVKVDELTPSDLQGSLFLSGGSTEPIHGLINCKVGK